MERQNAPDYANYLKLLGQKELIEEALSRFLMAYEELSQRDDAVTEFLEKLCSYSYTTKIWFTLWLGGRAYRYSELLPYVGCSPTTMSRSLIKLLGNGLILKRGSKYQAIYPKWLTPTRTQG